MRPAEWARAICRRESHLIKEDETMKETLQASWMATGVVEAPVEQVWEAYVATISQFSSEEKAAVARANGPVRFSLYKAEEYGAATAHMEADRQQHTFVLQGGWWYRGVHSIEPHERGSLLLYRVYNLAQPWQRWMIPLVLERNMPEKTCITHEQLLHQLGEQLGCRAYLT